MIEYQTGDLLTSDAEALVNTVNCVGVMGKGIALEFKKAFPDNFKDYAKACKRDEVYPGRMFITERLGNPKFIVNFPTKRHWRAKSRISDVESGLTALADEIRTRQIRSIAIPALGSGLGGLDWEAVRSLIDQELGELSADVQVMVFEPEGPPDAKVMARLTEAPEMTPGRAALLMLMRRYLAGQLESTIASQEVEKLMYLLQAAGEPLQLMYAKGRYGLYTDDLHPVLRKIEGHWVSGYSGGKGKSDKQFKLMTGAIEDAEALLQSKPNTSGCIAKVADLIDGFETPLGLELLTTVHWVTHKENSTSVDDVIHRIRDGKFYRKQIVQAYETLASLGWLYDKESFAHATGEHSAPAAGADASAGTVAEQGSDYSLIDGNSVLININTATASDLEALPRIGNKLAQAIIIHREKKGPFLTAQSITAVSGIGSSLYKSIADLIIVGPVGSRLL